MTLNSGCTFQEKKKKDVAPAAEAGLAMSVDELKQKIETLEQEKAKEEELRNYMQLERVRTCLSAAER